MRADLLRLSDEADAIRGVLLVDGSPVCATLELPWLDNRPGVSCIPEGNYVCGWYLSPTHGETLIVNKVPDRSYILFHAGNTCLDTNGCILVGEGYGTWQGRPAVFRSKVALSALKGLCSGVKEFPLTIRSV